MKSTKLKKLIGIMLTKNKYSLDALADVNIGLGIMAYKPEKPDFFQEESELKKESAGYRIWIKVVETAKNDNKKLKKLNSQTRYLLEGRILSAKTKEKILEKIGYEVI